MTDQTRSAENWTGNRTVIIWLVALGAFTLVLLIVGFSGLATGVGNLQGECSTTQGDTTTFFGCAKDTSGIWWGGAVAALGLLMLGLTLATGALTAAISGGRTDNRSTPEVPE